MTGSLRERVKLLLEQAAGLAPGARERLLANEHPAVRAEVERLLAAAADPPPLEGVLLDGRYRLEAVVGSGGFGTVYGARDERLDRTVAVKVLHHGVFSHEVLRTEIRALSEIAHTGVIDVLDAGRAPDGRRFLVTRFVEGRTMRQILAERGTVTEPEALAWGRELAGALGEAHRRSILHLDLRPENIMIENTGGGRGRAVILNFGVGRLMRPGAGPEARFVGPGAGSSASRPADDLRALTQILFFALAGRSDQSGLERMNPRWRRFFHEASVRPFESAADLEHALARIPRRPGAMWMVAAAALAAAGAAFLLSHRTAGSASFPLPVSLTTYAGEEAFPALSPDGRSVYFTWSPPGESGDIYSLRIGDPDPVRLTRDPARDANAACSPDGSRLAFLRNAGNERNALVLMPAAGGAEMEAARGLFGGVAWSPDPRYLAVVVASAPGTPNRILLLEWRTGAWLPFLDLPQGFHGDSAPAFSPDGSKVAFVRRSTRAAAQLHVAAVRGGLETAGEPAPVGPVYPDVTSPAWAPDGRSIFYAAGPRTDRRLYRVRLADPGRPEPIAAAGPRLEWCAIARSARRMVVARAQGNLDIWRADLAHPGGPVTNAQPIVSSPSHDEEPAIAPDGRTLAFVSQRNSGEQVWTAALDGAGQRQITSFDQADDVQVYWKSPLDLLLTGNLQREPRTTLFALATGAPGAISVRHRTVGLSRDGNSLYVVESIGGEKTLCRIPTAGGPRAVLAKGSISRAIESPDGKQVYYWVRTNEVWRVPVQGGTPERVLTGVPRRAFAVARSGVYYASGQPRPALRYRRTGDGAERELLRLQNRIGFGFDVSPDERFVVFSHYAQEGADLLLADDFDAGR